MAKDFLRAFEAKYKSSPASIWAVTAGDAFNVIVAAVKAKGTDKAAIAEYLHKDLKNFNTLTGTISFDEKGDRVGDLYRLYKIDSHGKFVLQRM